MNFDGSKRLEGAGEGVILISPEGDKLKYVLRMTFPNASNNEAEYEALIHGMKMAKACGATRLKIFGDSQLVAQQVMNQCDAVNDSMVAYKEMYNELEKLFDGCEVNHISRLSNDEADVLANIGSQCLAIPPGVFWEEITERSTKPKKSTKKEKNEKPSGAAKEALEEEEEEEEEEQALVLMVQIPWMQAYISYILRKIIPDDPVEARRVIRRSKAFTVIKGELYKRSDAVKRLVVHRRVAIRRRLLQPTSHCRLAYRRCTIKSTPSFLSPRSTFQSRCTSFLPLASAPILSSRKNILAVNDFGRDSLTVADMGIPFGYPLLVYLARLGPIWRRPKQGNPKK
ncbi:hypothetical protein QYE76_054491 [Lolium multiflorum]|uniref:RNase H type-1 domain-containing protein n=1 Tax=Lolium multiflorum TaxID=4521 RepID=A0AAD8SYQ1_LOLMU|nr:hypothetical protein QYE76_054491 [Lolium multiflorum]